MPNYGIQTHGICAPLFGSCVRTQQTTGYTKINTGAIELTRLEHVVPRLGKVDQKTPCKFWNVVLENDGPIVR